MKILAKLVASVFFLSIIRDVVSSNPDSEIVQDSTKSSKKRLREIRSAEERPGIALLDDRFSGIKILRRYYTDLGEVWREVGSSSGNSKIRIRDFGGFLDVSRMSSNNRTQPDRSFFSQGFGGWQPNVYSTNTGVPEPNGRVLYGYMPNGNAQNGRVPIDSSGDPSVGYPVPNGNVPDGRVSSGSLGGTKGGNPDPNGNPPNRHVPYWYVPNRNVPDRRVHNGTSYREPGKMPTNLPERGPTTPAPRNVLNYTRRGSPDEAKSHGKVSPDSNLFAGIVNDFTFKLMEAMKPQTSFVVSPLTIFVALSMCYLGAGGRTKSQIEQVMGLNDYSVHDLHLHQGISDLLSMFTQESDAYQLLQANLMLIANNLTIEEAFKEDVQKFYGAELENLDFRNQQNSIRKINEWVARNTRNAIPSLLSGPLPITTKLLLLSAIFFKGTWKTQFPLDATHSGQFYSLDGNGKEVPFMSLYREIFSFHHSDEHKHSFIRLPYKGDEVSMIIALPSSHQDEPMPSVTDKLLCHVQDAMTSVKLSSVVIPKFRLEYTESLKQSLMSMGISDMFDSSVNLTLMRKANDLTVADILHKAVIDVNEQGTTAAGVTSVQLVPLSATSEDFVANHPFAFYIVHEASGLVLFYGKVYDLGESSSSGNGEGYNVAPGENTNVPREGNVQMPQGNRRERPPYNRRINRENYQNSPSK